MNVKTNIGELEIPAITMAFVDENLAEFGFGYNSIGEELHKDKILFDKAMMVILAHVLKVNEKVESLKELTLPSQQKLWKEFIAVNYHGKEEENL